MLLQGLPVCVLPGRAAQCGAKCVSMPCLPGKAPKMHDALGLAQDEDAYEQHVSAHAPLTQSPELHCDPVLHEEPPCRVGGAAGFCRPSHVGSTQY